MPSTQEITRRIKSVKSTRKVTKAMQMVSAAKMRKAQTATVASRSYSHLAWELIQNVAKESTVKHPLMFSNPQSNKIGVIFLSTNRGMIGSLNANLANKLEKFAKQENAEMEIINYGKKGQIILSRMRKNLVADFEKYERSISAEDIYPIAQFVTKAYWTGAYKKFIIVYNHFKSTLIQEPTVRQLLPLAENVVGAFSYDQDEPSGERQAAEEGEYLFEPTPNDVINHLIPRIVESQIFQAVLESEASEHSARMVMMKNATEAAGDIISDLTLTYNGLRQNKITTELAEITAGKIALE